MPGRHFLLYIKLVRQGFNQGCPLIQLHHSAKPGVGKPGRKSLPEALFSERSLGPHFYISNFA